MKRMAALCMVLAMSACGGKASDDKTAGTQAGNRDSLTERQRDTMLAGSRIPGARGVGKAMRVADSTSAGVEQTNAVARDTTPE